MLVAFAVIGALLVIVIALLAVGGTVGRLGKEPARNVYEPNEAVEFVAQALPSEVTAELSYPELERILRLHHDFLHRQGVSRSGGDLPEIDGVQVVDPDEAVDYVVKRAKLVDFFPKPAYVRQAIDAQLAYFEAIGAARPVEGPTL